MVLVRRLEAQGRAARLQAGIASDRLLPRAVVYLHGRDDGGAAELDLVHDLLAEVLRVSDVRYTPEAMAHVAWRLMVDTTRTVDRRLDRETIQAGLENLQGEKAIDITKRLWDGMSVSIQVAGQALTLLPDEVAITSRAQPGWTAAHDAGLLLLLETG
jgi:hypothetical protein